MQQKIEGHANDSQSLKRPNPPSLNGFSSQMKVALTNIRGDFRGKKPLLEHFIHSNEIDFLAVEETWEKYCPDANPSNEVMIPGFRKHAVKRVNRRGGGVAVFVKNDLHSSILKYTSQDLVAVKVEDLNQNGIIVIAAYISPTIQSSCQFKEAGIN